jgi:histidine kinase/DNA gyrase B/HSP90-like ATPase
VPHYPPNPSVLRAIAAGRVGWPTACGEWIDNAFDRKATRVSITFEKQTLTIEDDGEGTDQPARIVQLGEHSATDGLGEFGMGGKESLLWAGGERSTVMILSSHRGITRRLEVSWLDFAKGWNLPEPSEWKTEPGEIGTKIQVRPLRSTVPKSFEQLCEYLGYIYSHAIRRDHKQITIKGPSLKERPRVVLPWQPPPFDESLPIARDVVVNVGNREALIYAGVVKEGVRNTKSGLTYWYGYRVVLEAGAHGCGNYHIGRLCGFVELRGGWKSALTRNKNGLTVDDDALFAEVERAIKPVLEAADQVGSTFQQRALSSRLESRIGEMLNATRDAKAKRAPGESHGTVLPADSERHHQRARQEQPGVRFPGTRNGRGLKVGYQPLGGTKLGEAKPPNITLNMDNPFIAQAVHGERDDVLILAISSLIADYDANEAADGRGNRYIRGIEPKSFPEQVGSIVASAPSLDGKPVLKVAG